MSKGCPKGKQETWRTAFSNLSNSAEGRAVWGEAPPGRDELSRKSQIPAGTYEILTCTGPVQRLCHNNTSVCEHYTDLHLSNKETEVQRGGLPKEIHLGRFDSTPLTTLELDGNPRF